MRILAVDDDVFIRELLPMILGQVGYTDVTVAPSGDVALEMIEAAEAAFDCLLLDIQMPGMDGIELCTRLRRMPAYARNPIIMLTAMTDRSFIDNAFAAGATDYVAKPFETIELGIRIRNAEELVSARRAALQAADAAPVSAGSERGRDVQIEGIGELIDQAALKNYLMQLSRAGLLSTQIVAIKVENIDALHARASHAEFGYALTEVAAAISDTLGCYGLLMAHVGSGLFACVSNNPAPLEPADIESAIQSFLDDRQAAYDDGQPMDLEVSVGAPIRSSATGPGHPDRAMERAIARAEARAQEKSRQRVNIRFGADPR